MDFDAIMNGYKPFTAYGLSEWFGYGKACGSGSGRGDGCGDNGIDFISRNASGTQRLGDWWVAYGWEN